MPPRPGIEPSDLVTPGEFAHTLGLPCPRVRKWIERAQRYIGREVQPLGQRGPYPVYDFNDLAALEREVRQRRQQRGGTAQAA